MASGDNIGRELATRIVGHFDAARMTRLLHDRQWEVARGLAAGMAPLGSDDLERALREQRLDQKFVRVTMGRRFVDKQVVGLVDGPRLRLGVLSQLLSQGAMIIFNRLERAFPALHSLSGDVAEQLGVGVEATAFLCIGERSGLETHHDPEDFFAIQLEGRKTWRLVGRPLPPGQPFATSKDDDADVEELTLDPGDVLFMPAGQRHVCLPSPAGSLHLGLLTRPTHAAAAAVDLLAQAMRDDPALNVPYVLASGIEPDEYAASYRRRMHELVDALDLEGALERDRIKRLPDRTFRFPEAARPALAVDVAK